MKPEVDFMAGGQPRYQCVVQYVLERRVLIKDEQHVFYPVTYVIIFSVNGFDQSPCPQFIESFENGIPGYVVLSA